MSEILEIDGTALTVRPISITDAEGLAQLFTRLSSTSVYQRFFSPINRPPRAALLRLADVDHCRREALVALDGDEIVAVARYDARPDALEAEIAVTVADAWQHRGLGSQLSRRLGKLARDRGYQRFTANMLAENRAALALMRRMSPNANVRFVSGGYEASLPLVHAS